VPRIAQSLEFMEKEDAHALRSKVVVIRDRMILYYLRILNSESKIRGYTRKDAPANPLWIELILNDDLLSYFLLFMSETSGDHQGSRHKREILQ
jgi:hypothetical protein